MERNLKEEQAVTLKEREWVEWDMEDTSSSSWEEKQAQARVEEMSHEVEFTIEQALEAIVSGNSGKFKRVMNSLKRLGQYYIEELEDVYGFGHRFDEAPRLDSIVVEGEPEIEKVANLLLSGVDSISTKDFLLNFNAAYEIGMSFF